MVKGVSRQVIVVKSPEGKLFEQAIFILREDAADGVTDEMLLREAQKATQSGPQKLLTSGPVWACGGAVCTALVWLLTALV